MKKMIYIFLLFLSINIFSSDWEFGVKAGVNYNHFEFTELYSGEEGFDDKLDFLLGGIVKKNINNMISINFEILYNRKSFYLNNDSGDQLNRVYYLEFPIILNFKYCNFEFQLGGYISKYITSYSYIKGDSGKEYIDWNHLKFELNNWDVGYILGLGYRFYNFIFELRYSRSLRGGGGAPVFGERLDYFDQWAFNIGYFFW